MKSFKQYINEAVYKHGKGFDQIDAALDHADNRSRKTYIERLSKMSVSQLNDVENAIEAEATKYINSEYKKSGTWDEKKEMDISVNAMDAMIDSIIN